MEDSEIQLDLLGDKNQDMTLEQMLRFIEAKEGRQHIFYSQMSLMPSLAVLINIRERTQWRSHCQGSKIPVHIVERKVMECTCKPEMQTMPSIWTVCGHYRKDHHFESVCRVKVVDTANESAIFNLASVLLGHNVYGQRSNRWVGCSSKPQPFVRLSVSIEKEDYQHFELQLSFSADYFLIDAMADTGYQSCLVGLELIENTGMSRRHLIPVTMRMLSADNHNISILGAVIFRLRESGCERMTQQIIYVTDSTDKFFLG